MLSPRMPDATSLGMLVAVANHGSFSAAGKALGLSQQAISSRMRSLESRLGVSLLLRTPRGSTLTQDGVLVGLWARDVLAAAELLDVGAAALRGEGHQELVVAASQAVAEHLLPVCLVELLRGQELSTTASVRSAVAAGTAPAVTSALAVCDDLALQRLVRVPLRGVALNRTITALWRIGGQSHAGPARDLISLAGR